MHIILFWMSLLASIRIPSSLAFHNCRSYHRTEYDAFRYHDVVHLTDMTYPFFESEKSSSPSYYSNPQWRVVSALSMTDSISSADQPKKKKKKKKKSAFTINENFVGSISSDGTITRAPRSQGRLGVPSKKKKQQKQSSSNTVNLTKQEKQRTGNGLIDSSKQTLLSDATTKAEEPVQVVEGKRGNKVVTMIRGMTTPMDERKLMLKEFKKKFGGGGTLIDGVLELQGSHADKIVDMLKAKGYLKAKKI